MKREMRLAVGIRGGFHSDPSFRMGIMTMSWHMLIQYKSPLRFLPLLFFFSTWNVSALFFSSPPEMHGGVIKHNESARVIFKGKQKLLMISLDDLLIAGCAICNYSVDCLLFLALSMMLSKLLRLCSCSVSPPLLSFVSSLAWPELEWIVLSEAKNRSNLVLLTISQACVRARLGSWNYFIGFHPRVQVQTAADRSQITFGPEWAALPPLLFLPLSSSLWTEVKSSLHNSCGSFAWCREGSACPLV